MPRENFGANGQGIKPRVGEIIFGEYSSNQRHSCKNEDTVSLKPGISDNRKCVINDWFRIALPEGIQLIKG